MKSEWWLYLGNMMDGCHIKKIGMLVLYNCGLYFENIKHFSILHLNEFKSSVCVRGKVCALSAC